MNQPASFQKLMNTLLSPSIELTEDQMVELKIEPFNPHLIGLHRPRQGRADYYTYLSATEMQAVCLHMLKEWYLWLTAAHEKIGEHLRKLLIDELMKKAALGEHVSPEEWNALLSENFFKNKKGLEPDILPPEPTTQTTTPP